MDNCQITNPLNGNYRQDKKIGNDMYYVREFANLDEFYNLVCDAQGNDEYSSHREDDEDEPFHGTSTFDEAVKLARYGWEKGLKDLDYYEDMADKAYASKSNDNMWDVELSTTGSYVDVGAYLQGVPECMCDFVSKRTNTFADIIVNPTVSCWVKPVTIMNRGREIMKLVDALEKRHIKTRVVIISVVCSDNVNEGDRWITKVTAKDYNEMLDQNRLVFALAHAAYPRRMMFALQELEKDIRRDFGCPYGGYGRPGNVAKLPDEVWKPQFENTYTFVFDDVNHYKEDVKDVKNRVEKIVTGR